MGIMTAVMFTDIDFRETVSDAPVGDSYDGGVSFWAFGSCIGEEDEVGDDGTAMKFDEHGGGIDTGAVGDDERDGGFNNHGVVGISYRMESLSVVEFLCCIVIFWRKDSFGFATNECAVDKNGGSLFAGESG
jgi:hypothetical protein